MNGDVIAVGRFDSEWSMNRFTQIVDGRFFVIVFVTVWLVGGDFPGGRIEINVKFGQFIGNSDALEFGLSGYFVAKSNCIIINTKSQRDNPV